MTGYALHLIARDGPLPRLAIEEDRAIGLEVRCVLLGDAVYMTAEAAPVCDRLLRDADACRRRGLHAGGDAVDHGQIIELIAGAARVVSW